MNKTNMKAAVAAAEAMGKRSDLWKPDPGVHYVRVLPGVGDMGENFFSGFALHWGFGDPILCPRRMFNMPCVFCQYGNQLPENEGKKFWASWSAYMNILLVDEDGDPIPDAEGDAQVKVWRVGRETLGKIFNAIERESPSTDSLIDITDPKQGVDLRIKRTGKTAEDTDWDIALARRGPSDITPYTELYEPKMVDVSAYVKPLATEQMKEILVSGGTGSGDPFGKAAIAASKPKAKLLASKVAREVSEDGGTVVVTGTVIQPDGEEIEAVEEKPSAGKAKLGRLLAKAQEAK